MIVVYPLLLVVAAVVAVPRRHLAAGRGSAWLALWIAAGALFTFSLLTGFSIGLLLLPAAATLLLVAAWASPHLAEAAGFAVGAGAVPFAVGALGWPGADWVLTGAALMAVGLAVTAAARRSRGRASASPRPRPG